MVEPPSEALMTSGYRPGLIADIIRAHMAYYAPAWGFGLPFEAKLAAEMAAFFTRYDERSDLTLTAYEGADKFLASVTLDGLDHAGPEGGHLRWFIATAEGRARRGLGRRLVAEALAFADTRGYAKVYLTTFAGLDAARHLYETEGFALVSETASDTWSGTVGEQRFERCNPARD